MKYLKFINKKLKISKILKKLNYLFKIFLKKFNNLKFKY